MTDPASGPSSEHRLDPDLDPLRPEHLEDPFPVYRRLRQTEGLPLHPGLGTFLVSRHEECRQVLLDPDFVKDFRLLGDSASGSAEGKGESEAKSGAEEEGEDSAAELSRLRSHWCLVKDGDEHRRLRGVTDLAFRKAPVESLRRRVEARVHGLLDALPAEGTVDWVASFASPLPLGVICELTGLEDVDGQVIRRWSDLVLRTPEVGASHETYHEAGVQSVVLEKAILAQISRPVQVPETETGTDGVPAEAPVLAAVRAAREKGRGGAGGLESDHAMASILSLLLLGGYDTTAYALANGLRLLLAPSSGRRPWDLLRNDPPLLRAAVEEILRFDPSLHRTNRMALREKTVGGQTIPRGGWVSVLLASANRDESVFPEPHVFRLDRPATSRHLTLGRGSHYCQGARLVRLELEVALGALLERRPELELGGGPAVRRPTATFRAWQSLPVRLR